MKFTEIQFERKNGIAKLIINRPDMRNAITGEKMVEEFTEACRLVNESREINVLIISAVDPAFSAGGNVKDMKEKKGMFKGSPARIMQNYQTTFQRVLLNVYNAEVPVIGAVNGPAIGAGCGLAMLCDIRVASEKAKFGITFLNVGLVPGDGETYTLPRVIGFPRASEMIYTGEVIDALKAHELGFVNHVVPHEKLMEKAEEIAGKISGKPPEALRMTKRLMRAGQVSTLEAVLEKAAAFQSLCHSSEDHMEALDAMFEKREPVFKGK